VVVVIPALADTTGVVNASVTPQVVLSVALDVTSVAYGTLSTSTSNVSRSTGQSMVITATNNGNSIEDLRIYTANAIPVVGGDATWVLHCEPADANNFGTVDVNQYVHRFDNAVPLDSADGRTICTNANQKILSDNLPASGSHQFVLQLNMPTSTTGFSQRDMAVTIVAFAP
jgi:hypothetical protein